ncbi:MAG: triphosphoribosyl-dephospho-CoA synthase [Candidatus Bathyarchaeia archaeon]|jgi:triphosphoribosyl-dephospho-CoA synthase
MRANNRAKHIARCLELAILLEVSAHKPGNVSVINNFEKTLYGHFLASAVAAASSFETAAQLGILVSQGKIDVADVGVGRLIKRCIADINAWQHGGNTLLGVVILLSPIAVAAGMTSTTGYLNLQHLRKNLKLITESTTPRDAVNMYAAIEIANPSGLGKAPALDINDPDSVGRILEDKISLYKIFKIAEKYDTICSEWVNNYPITFDLAYPSLTKRLQNKDDPNSATVQTFLEVLAKVPDTFIARKTGIEKSREISLRARHVLNLGGIETSVGKKSLSEFDQELRKSGNLLNPGTTADILAAALALCVLNGYRP